MLRRAALFLGLLMLTVSCATVDDVKSPTVSLVEVEMGRTGLLSQELVLTLRVGNPNDFAIPLEGLALSVAVNGRDLADGLSDETVTLPRLGYADVTVLATASTLGVIRELISLGSDAKLGYSISGTAYVGTPLGRRAVPYDKTGTFSILSPAPREPKAPQRRNDRTILKSI